MFETELTFRTNIRFKCCIFVLKYIQNMYENISYRSTNLLRNWMILAGTKLGWGYPSGSRSPLGKDFQCPCEWMLGWQCQPRTHSSTLVDIHRLALMPQGCHSSGHLWGVTWNMHHIKHSCLVSHEICELQKMDN